MKDNQNNKSAWNDVSFIWKRIAGVITAVGVLATLTVQIFKTPADITYVIFAFLGLILLMISWYVDKQISYTNEQVEKIKEEAKDEFSKSLNETKSIFEQHRESTSEKMNMFENTLNKLVEVSEDTRKDTIRIQLLMIMKDQPENIDTILKLAETYFVKLHGDWYMTSEFMKWAKEQDVTVPLPICNVIDAELNNK